jgi:hypothetical protein
MHEMPSVAAFGTSASLFGLCEVAPNDMAWAPQRRPSKYTGGGVQN